MVRGALYALAIVTAGAAAMACNSNASVTSPSRSEEGPTATTTAMLKPAITWPASSAVDERALASLVTASARDAEVRAKVSRSPVPVLAPKELRFESSSLVVEGEYFALTGRVAGAMIVVQGTRAAHRHEELPALPGNRDLRGTRGMVSMNEGVRTASWLENGAAYTVDVECSDASDARCQSESFVLSVAGQLTFVGGAGR